jgi:hypothetical protein
LLSAADITSVMRTDYQAGVPDSVGQCYFDTVANPSVPLVAAISPFDLSFVKSTFAKDGKDETVAGHAAFYNPSEGLASLWVDVGPGSVLVLTFPSSGSLRASFEPQMIDLATAALGNM